MAKWLILVLLVAVSVLFQSYYKEVSDAEPEPWKLRNMAFFAKTIPRFMAKLLHTIGLYDEVEFTRMWRVAISHKMENSTKITITEHYFDGVRILQFAATSRPANSPAFVYYHGGGWVYHTPEEFGAFTKNLAEKLNCVVFSVDYRRAPEHPYPAAFEDSLIATKYVLRNAADFGVDPTRVAIGGDSAGGNLVATVGAHLHLHRKELKLPAVKLHLNMYPVMQCEDFTGKSYVDNSDNIMLRRDDMIYYCLRYLYGRVGPNFFAEVKKNNKISAELDKKINDAKVKFTDEKSGSGRYEMGFSPIYMKDKSLLAGHPTSYLITCERDTLRDEGAAYGKFLLSAGVEVVHKDYDTVHGAPFFAMKKNYATGIIVLNDIIDFFKKNL